jgi:diadenosine tetraphosphatase ApaH/serine/threonine PP2A family protein phosphatase
VQQGCEPGADGKTLFGEADGRRHHLGELHRPVRAQGEVQTGDRAGNGDGATSDGRGLRVHAPVGAQIHFARRLLRGLLAVVHKARAAVRQAHEHEAPAADIAGFRLDHGERKRDRHGCVHGVAALLEGLDAGFGGKRFIAHHHGLSRAHRLRRPLRMRCRTRAAEFARLLRMSGSASEERGGEQIGQGKNSAGESAARGLHGEFNLAARWRRVNRRARPKARLAARGMSGGDG